MENDPNKNTEEKIVGQMVENPDNPGEMITKEKYKDIMKGKEEDPDWFRVQK